MILNQAFWEKHDSGAIFQQVRANKTQTFIEFMKPSLNLAKNIMNLQQ